jgi:hypothetical protein
MLSLFKCPGCHCLIKRSETTCPFCGSAIAAAPSPLRSRRSRRVSRSRWVLLGTAAGAATIAACDQSSRSPLDPSSSAADAGDQVATSTSPADDVGAAYAPDAAKEAAAEASPGPGPHQFACSSSLLSDFPGYVPYVTYCERDTEACAVYLNWCSIGFEPHGVGCERLSAAPQNHSGPSLCEELQGITQSPGSAVGPCEDLGNGEIVFGVADGSCPGGCYGCPPARLFLGA